MSEALRPSPRAIDPGLQAIFDAMLAYMGDTYQSLNAQASVDANGKNLAVNVLDFAGGRWGYTEFIAGVRVAVTPTGIALGPGGTQQFTATATNPDGSAVAGAAFAWSMQSGIGSVSATGLYTAPATIPQNTGDTLRVALVGGTSWTTVTISLHP